MEPLPKSDDGLVEVGLATNWEGWKPGDKLRVDPVRAAAMAEEGVLAGKPRATPSPTPVEIAVVPRAERRKRQTPAPGEAAAPMAPSMPERGDA
jgi:hypothetical protein